MSEKKLHFIKSVECLPSGTRGRVSFYDEIVREFLYSGAKYAEVKDIGKKPLAILVGIKNRVEKRKDKIQVIMRNGKIYLARSNSEEQEQSGSENIKTFQSTISSNKNYDVINLLGTAIVKARCPRCQALNSKDSRVCHDCRHDIYTNEMEYQNSLREMVTLEKTLNS